MQGAPEDPPWWKRCHSVRCPKLPTLEIIVGETDKGLRVRAGGTGPCFPFLRATAAQNSEQGRAGQGGTHPHVSPC